MPSFLPFLFFIFYAGCVVGPYPVRIAFFYDSLRKNKPGGEGGGKALRTSIPFPRGVSWPVLKGRILLEETGFESTPFPFAGKRKTKTISTLPQA